MLQLNENCGAMDGMDSPTEEKLANHAQLKGQREPRGVPSDARRLQRESVTFFVSTKPENSNAWNFP
jgi:hypothetical protein